MSRFTSSTPRLFLFFLAALSFLFLLLPCFCCCCSFLFSPHRPRKEEGKKKAGNSNAFHPLLLSGEVTQQSEEVTPAVLFSSPAIRPSDYVLRKTGGRRDPLRTNKSATEKERERPTTHSVRLSLSVPKRECGRPKKMFAQTAGSGCVVAPHRWWFFFGYARFSFGGSVY